MHPLQKILRKIQFETGDVEFKIRSYSGRGMYGKECLGIELNSYKNVLQLGYLIHQYDEENELDVDELKLLSDNMGLDTIIYFRKIPYDNSEDELVKDEY